MSIVEGADAPEVQRDSVPEAPVPTYEPPIANLTEAFTYHAPDEQQKVVYEMIRQGALNYARIIERYVPACADRTAAIRKLRESVMTANAAVALKGRI